MLGKGSNPEREVTVDSSWPIAPLQPLTAVDRGFQWQLPDPDPEGRETELHIAAPGGGPV